METREYFTVPPPYATTFPQGKSLHGGIHVERREPGTSSSGSNSSVSSSFSNPKLATNRWTIFTNQGKILPRSTHDDDPDPYFLDTCFLCKRPLSRDRDIFMYRGDIPFCSEECREEQIKSDEMKESRGVFLKASTPRKGRKNSSTKSIEIHAPGPAVAG